MKNILIVAAENSAENYGSKIIEQFEQSDHKVSFFGAGGDELQKRGVELIVHSKELSIVGIVEVLSSIIRLKKIMGRILDSCKRKKADGAILIDYPDFNLRLAKKLKKAGIPVYYYISPTVWAWRYSRVKIIRKYVDHMFIIFPFEQEIYKREKIPFTYTGHPLVPSIRIKKGRDIFRKEFKIRDGEKVLSLLPGSRLSEIESLLPEMLSAIKILRSQIKFKAIILKADNINKEIIERIINSSGIEVDIINQKNRYDLFNASDAALASCGTSNLELAVCGLPFVAVYKVNKLSYLLGKGFLKISLYSIV
ncbi:MAG: lipid-A-disaccharide synthase, partial [Candidatus Aminicenantes bacterium]|nr:lipid-A-disaccharide synthase [Candidatus Aminicenantes bacterium]